MRLLVSKTTRPEQLAGAIAGEIRQDHAVEVSAVGGMAVHQAAIGVALARGYVASDGLDLVARPRIETEATEGGQRTIIILTCASTPRTGGA